MDFDDQAIIENMAQRILRQRLRKAVQLVTAVADKGDKKAERIHRLRSESRRADAALRLFTDWTPYQRASQIQQELNDIRDRSGRVRDLDVMIPQLTDQLQQLPDEAVDWLLERAEEARAKEGKSLRRYVRKLLKKDFANRVRTFTRRIHWRQTMADPTLHEAGLSAVDQLANQFFSKVDLLEHDIQNLHKVRILGRRLRYTLDLLREALPAEVVDSARQALAEIQDSLGSANDQQSLLSFLQESATHASSKPFAVPLLRLIESLKTTISTQQTAVVRDLLEKAQMVRTAFAQFGVSLEATIA